MWHRHTAATQVSAALKERGSVHAPWDEPTGARPDAGERLTRVRWRPSRRLRSFRRARAASEMPPRAMQVTATSALGLPHTGSSGRTRSPTTRYAHAVLAVSVPGRGVRDDVAHDDQASE